MEPLSSRLNGVELLYDRLKQAWKAVAGNLGGNWSYEKGSWDVALDEGHNYWLRIPFRVIKGRLDGEADQNDAIVRLEQPFVLHHEPRRLPVPNSEDTMTILPALFNQFQSPAVVDGPIHASTMELARVQLKLLEKPIIAIKI